MRRAVVLALLVAVLAGCGESAQPPRRAEVARTLRAWVGAFRAEDPDALCARTFMAYDVRRSAERVRQDCLATYGDGLRTLHGKPRIVRIGRIAIEGPGRLGGGITRTARADLTVRYRTPAGAETRDWRARLVLYRGRWRILQGAG